MTLEAFLLTIALLYVFMICLFLYGIGKSANTENDMGTPFVSVLIAARNEEQFIERCLRSLLRQTYPSSLFEVIVIDDASTDKTRDICNHLGGEFDNFRIISGVREANLTGKTSALIHGVDAAIGDIVFVTDADCVVPETWIQSSLKHYSSKTGMVGGFTLQYAENSFQGMQSLDWAYLLGIASALVKLRSPLSMIGNNISFRRKAYEDIGGYRRIQSTVTEDYALVQAMVKRGGWECRYPPDRDLLVMTSPCDTIRDLVQQKHRWGKGGVNITLRGFFIMAVGFFLHLAIPLTFFTGSAILSVGTLAIKWCADFVFLHAILRRIDRVEDLRFFISFQIYYHCYILVLPLVVVFGGTVAWKGRTY